MDVPLALALFLLGAVLGSVATVKYLTYRMGKMAHQMTHTGMNDVLAALPPEVAEALQRRMMQPPDLNGDPHIGSNIGDTLPVPAAVVGDDR